MYKNVYTTGLDYQEMIVLWFLVLRTKVVWYETFQYKMEDVVDAGMINWDKWDHLYLYPPSSLISKALAKLTDTHYKSAVLVTPDFATRLWAMALQIRKVPSITMKVNLQQIVNGKLVKAPKPTRLRVWRL